MNLAEAKLRLTIHELWRHFQLEGQPSKSCRCPLHEDRSASFSVTPDGTLWNCFAGCGGGDAVDFFAALTRLPHGEACRAFIALAQGAPVAPMARRAPCKADNEAEAAERRKTWPAFEDALECEFQSGAMTALATLRHVCLAGVELAAARGLLWFAPWKDSPAWIVTDGARVNAQVRQMTGRPWPGINAKAQTLPGSRASWPIGLKESEPFAVALLCEGGPDLLAAHHFIREHGRTHDTAAVAMLGASQSIAPEALPLFAGKRVRIVAHADEAGRTAAARWADQLETAGANVDAADLEGLTMLDGSPAKDLNDLTRIQPNQKPQLQDMIP